MTTLEEQVEQEQAAHEDEAAEAESAFEAPADVEVQAEPVEEAPQVGFTPEQLRKADRAIDAHRKKLGEILGAEYVAHQCLLCAGVGSVSDLPPVGTEFAIFEQEGEVIFLVKPPTDEPAYRVAPDKEECPECAGLGMVLTGAKTEHGRVAPCGKCAGNGWIVKPRDAGPEPVGVGVLPVPPLTEQAASLGLANDAWGRPAGHQHWGVPPAQIPG